MLLFGHGQVPPKESQSHPDRVAFLFCSSVLSWVSSLHSLNGLTRLVARLGGFFFIHTMRTIKPTIKMANQATVRRASGTQRLTGNSLYAIQKRFERNNPRLCAECARIGSVGFGAELDHIVPLWQGGAESDLNRQWLCGVHHREKTAAEATQRASWGGREGG